MKENASINVLFTIIILIKNVLDAKKIVFHALMQLIVNNAKKNLF